MASSVRSTASWTYRPWRSTSSGALSMLFSSQTLKSSNKSYTIREHAVLLEMHSYGRISIPRPLCSGVPFLFCAACLRPRVFSLEHDHVRIFGDSPLRSVPSYLPRRVLSRIEIVVSNHTVETSVTLAEIGRASCRERV